MKNKFKRFFKKTSKNIIKYVSMNRLFLSFLLFAMIETMLVRNFTLGNVTDYKPLICDLALLLFIGAFGYLFKPAKQFRYYFVWLIIVTAMCMINSIYYVFYTSFASFSLIAELSLLGEVGDSVTEKLRVIDLMYIAFPFLYFYIHRMLKMGNYYNFVSKVEKGKKMFFGTVFASLFIAIFTAINITPTDASRLVKLWNREYVVQRFGIVMYQGNDLVQSLTPKISSLFGYDEAAKNFREYYAKRFKELDKKQPNKYTNILEGKNVIFVHMESIQSFLMNKEFNGVEVTPTANKLSKEGMYFSNFYPQISVGTSSDTEFTLNTSLMPASSGTVFVGYYNRDYTSIPKLLKEKGYYTFSAHANNATMWNRNKMHPSLGYEGMYFKDTYKFDEEKDRVGLGLKDTIFFEQLGKKIEKIEGTYENYMGTILQLSNHSPFAGTDWNPEIYDELGSIDLTNTYHVTSDKDDEESEEQVEKTDDYLKGTKLGNYIISAHYADLSLGQFLEYVKNSEYYNNTVFVFYGDHDARLDRSEYQYYYNYDRTTGELAEEGDENYRNYDTFQHEMNKRTPLIIWSKDEELNKKLKYTNDNVMGMYDVMPTIGNMMGFTNKFALGHDIYDIGEDNVVVFPNGSFVTNKVYYSNSSGDYTVITCNSVLSNINEMDPSKNECDPNAEPIVISDSYISDLKEYAENILDVSNDVIVHDLIKNEGKNVGKKEIDNKSKEEEKKNG